MNTTNITILALVVIVILVAIPSKKDMESDLGTHRQPPPGPPNGGDMDL